MSKHVYISADYSKNNGDCNEVEEPYKCGKDDYHIVDYCDTDEVVSGRIEDVEIIKSDEHRFSKYFSVVFSRGLNERPRRGAEWVRTDRGKPVFR